MGFKDFLDQVKNDLAASAKRIVRPGEETASEDLPPTIPPDPQDQQRLSSSGNSVNAPPPSSGGVMRGSIEGRAPQGIPSSSSSSPNLPPPDPNRIAGLGHRGESGKAPLVINDAEDTVYQKRKGIVDEVEERFGRFGPRISSYIMTQLMMPTGLKGVLPKLDLKSKGFEGGDKMQIEAWIEKNGPEEFSKRVGLRSRESESENPMNAPSTKSQSPLKFRTMDPARAAAERQTPPEAQSSSGMPLPPPTSRKPSSVPPPVMPQRAGSGSESPLVKKSATGSPEHVAGRMHAPENIKPVAVTSDMERRTSMARSPQSGVDHPPPTAPPPPPTSLPPPPPTAVPPPAPYLPAAPPKLPPPVAKADREFPLRPNAPEQGADQFLQNFLDESSHNFKKS